MSGNDQNGLHRRDFLQTSALAGASALTLAQVGMAADDPPASKKTLPTRKLGKTGVDVTLLNLGTWQASGLDRMLRTSYATGVRYYDTAHSYGSEPGIKKWFEQMPEVRKNIFLVTKDNPSKVRGKPGDPKDFVQMIDERCESLGVDQIDLFFWHAMGDNNEALDLPKSKELADAFDKIRKSGKAKFVGFSTHHVRRAEYIQAAVDGGFTDAIMLQYTPWLAKDSALNKALDNAHKAGIGLISMKQVAGNADANNNAKGKTLDEVFVKAPVLKERGLSAYQGLLTAIWSDERIATSCVSMKNTDQIRENAAAAANFTPMNKAEIDQLRDAMLAAGPSMCADCEGQCALAAGTKARLGDITRYLTYHDHHGHRTDARQRFAELSAMERDWAGADLEAAREACPSRLDFARLLGRADEIFA